MSNKKLELLIVTKNLPPQIGGIERLTFQTIRLLSEAFSCTVVGPKQSRSYLKKYCNFVGCRSSNLFLFFLDSILQSVRLSNKHKYHAIYAASGLTAPIVKIANIFNKSKQVTYVHGLDVIAENYIYKKLFVPSILSSNLVIANSTNTANLVLNKGFKRDLLTINPGVEIPGSVFEIDNSFKTKYSINDKLVLLTVGRLVNRKGISEFILSSLPNIVKKFPNAVYVIIGSEPTSALKKENPVRKKILSSINQSGMSKNVLLIDSVSDDELKSAYLSSNVFVFPILNLTNDIEGFGMVAAEAAANGLKTVAFNVGGVRDAVVDGKTGYLLQPQDYSAMTEKVCSLLGKENNFFTRKECQKYAKRYSWMRFGEEISEAFKSL